MSRGWWWGVAALGASALVVRSRAREPWTLLNAPGSRAAMGIIGAAAACYGVARLTRGAAPAASYKAHGPAAPRARRGFMTPRALALVTTERRTTMA